MNSLVKNCDGSTAKPKYLIVNADDYGYFNCVSRGILDCVRHGTVTATGVFATSPFLEQHAGWLATEPRVDVGVHLNLTDRSPLTRRLADALAPWHGRFPGKFALATAIVTGRIKLELVHEEWRAQIERCLSAGLRPVFLNSHQHVHMLPSLFELTTMLAREYRIAHVRLTTPEVSQIWSPMVIVRDALMLLMAWRIRASRPLASPRFLGMGASGHLSRQYLSGVLPKLISGRIYELMCHPGYSIAEEIVDPRIRHYHSHEQELRTLIDPSLPDLLAANNVRLVGYRHLQLLDNTLSVEP